MRAPALGADAPSIAALAGTASRSTAATVRTTKTLLIASS
jgi:hypothetical protein